MKRALLVLAAAALFAVAAHAQAPTQVTLEWTTPAIPSTDPSGETITGAIIYRASCTGTVTGTTQTDGSIVGSCSVTPAQSAFTALQTLTTPSSILCTAASGYTACAVDKTIVAGASYVYDVEEVAICPTCTGTTTADSSPSNLVAVLVPNPVVTPPAPSNLNIIAAIETVKGSKATLSASWSDAPGVPTVYSIWAAGKLVRSGGPAATSAGMYSVSLTAKLIEGEVSWIDVCDATAPPCASATFLAPPASASF